MVNLFRLVDGGADEMDNNLMKFVVVAVASCRTRCGARDGHMNRSRRRHTCDAVVDGQRCQLIQSARHHVTAGKQIADYWEQ
jgi:hypothetical protein